MSYLDSQQQLATKVQMDWTSATSLFSALSVSTTWTDLTGTSQTFVVDDPTSVIEISVSGFVTATLAASVANVAVRVSIDNGAVVKPLGGCPPIGGTGVTGDANVLAGANLITVTGLSAGSHTVKLQAWADATTNLYCRPPFPPEFISIRVLEHKVLPSIFSGPQPTTKVQLDYEATTNLATDLAYTAGTWTNVGPSNSFTVDDPNSIVEINVGGCVMINANTGTQEVGSRLLIDGSTTKYLGGDFGGSGINTLAGASAVDLTGLAAGSHTVQLQVTGRVSNGVIECQPANFPGYHSLHVRVLERKQTAALVSNCLVKLAEVSVGALGQANIQFSNIPQTYRHLQLWLVARNDGANNEQNGYMQFNGDTGANYEFVQIQGYNNGAVSGYGTAQNQWYFGQICGANASTGKASHFVIDIPNYVGTVFYKAMSSRGQNRTGFTLFPAEQLHSGAWNNTAAITSILLFPAGGNFVQGSIASLYAMN